MVGLYLLGVAVAFFFAPRKTAAVAKAESSSLTRSG
jgi:hypothetical protein